MSLRTDLVAGTQRTARDASLEVTVEHASVLRSAFQPGILPLWELNPQIIQIAEAERSSKPFSFGFSDSDSKLMPKNCGHLSNQCSRNPSREH